MVEILELIFCDRIHFLGTIAILLIIVWGISNFTLVRINISNYHLASSGASETEVNDNEEM